MQIKKELTKRQQIVFELYKKGLTQEQIAQKLGIYQGDVTHIIEAIRNKGYAQEIREAKESRKELKGGWLEAAKELGL